MGIKARVTAILAVLGGICWVAACLVGSTRPIRADSPVSDVLGALAFLAALLLGLATVGLAACVMLRDQFSRLGWGIWLRIMTGQALLGAGVLLLAGEIFDPSGFWRGSAIFAVIIVLTGLTLVTLIMIRSDFRPAWVSVPLWFGAPFLLAVQEEAAMLFAVPFGLAWIAVGLILWREASFAQFLPSISA